MRIDKFFPEDPGAPAGPAGPVTPASPLSPLSPLGPSKHAVSVNAATHAIIEIATRMICPSSHSNLNYLRLAFFHCGSLTDIAVLPVQLNQPGGNATGVLVAFATGLYYLQVHPVSR